MSQASPRKSLRIRAQWQAHIDAQTISGLSQAVYCRQHGISAGSFSAWKQKLNSVTTGSRRSEQVLSSVAASKKPTVIPVIVKKEPRQVNTPSSEAESTPDEITLKATLPNGIALELIVLSGNAFTRVLSQLGQWSC
jgi:transposase-like protein